MPLPTKSLLRRLLPFCLPALVLAAWALLTAAGSVPPLLLPSPGAVAERAWRLLASGELLQHAAVSMARVFAGFLISASAALSLALLIHRRPLLEETLSLVLESLRVIPPLSLVPLLILWLGIDEAPKLAIVVLASFFPIYLSSLTALRGVRTAYSDLVRMLGLTEAEAVREICIPGAAPGIITGLRLGFGYAWRALVGAELIAAASGLGYLIEDASSLARTDVVLVGILSIALLGILCDQIFGRLAALLTPWQGRSERPVERAADAIAKGAPKTACSGSAREAADAAPRCGIALEALTVTYPGLSSPPVHGLSFEAAPGTVTAILGRSGCGKTTLLKALAGLLSPLSGSIHFTGRPAPKIALVFQEPTLLPWKTVRENAELALLPDVRKGALTQSAAQQSAAEALSLTGLSGLAERYPRALSGGQQQRAGLARALAARPDILLMDEPFGALDALTRLELQDVSRRLFSARRMTVIMITHDVREAVRMADRALVLREGRVASAMALDLPYPRRAADPRAAQAEESLLAELMRR